MYGKWLVVFTNWIINRLWRLNNVIDIYNVSTDHAKPRYTYRLEQHEGYITSCKFIDDHYLVSTGGDGLAVLWDLAADKPSAIRTYKNLSPACVIDCCELNRDRGMFITGDYDGWVYAYDWRERTKQYVFKLQPHEQDVWGLNWFPDNHAFFSA